MDYSPQESYIIGVNDFVFDVAKSLVDHAEIVKTSEGRYHMIHHSRTKKAEILEIDATFKK